MTKPGESLAVITLKTSQDWTKSDPVPFHVNGKAPLYFRFADNGRIDLLDFSLQNE